MWQNKGTVASSVLDALFIKLVYVKGMIESIENEIDDIKFARKKLPWYNEPKSGMMLSCFLLEDYFIKYHHVWDEERKENARSKIRGPKK